MTTLHWPVAFPGWISASRGGGGGRGEGRRWEGWSGTDEPEQGREANKSCGESGLSGSQSCGSSFEGSRDGLNFINLTFKQFFKYLILANAYNMFYVVLILKLILKACHVIESLQSDQIHIWPII